MDTRKTILIKDILLPSQEENFQFQQGWLKIEGNTIAAMGYTAAPCIHADFIIEGRGKLALPGFINLHHHMYQTLTRCYPPAINARLFDWLKCLYPVWANLDEEAVYLSTIVACAELMSSGCTTAVDHHYVFPRGTKNLIDIQMEAAAEVGVRFCATRGSMNLSQKDGGLPPDSVVEDMDTILKDSERLLHKYHDTSFGSMTSIALAPCSPFSVRKELMVESANLARLKNARLHTHLCETKDEEDYCLQKYGVRPVELLEEVGWLHGNVWLAHGIYFDEAEIQRLGQNKVGIAHCPTSNMRLGSGVCKVRDLLRHGSPVGLAVDGSASNDSSNMLAELRQALLLTRVIHGADSITCSDVLKMATIEGAKCLGRTDIGMLTPGMAADIAIFDLNRNDYSGTHDPLGALILCQPTPVDTLIVNGKIRISQGQFQMPVHLYIERHRQKAREIAEKPGSQ